MGRPALALAILGVAGATSCADVSGLSDYSSCSGDCRDGEGASADGPGSGVVPDSTATDEMGMTGQNDVTEPIDSGVDSTFPDTVVGSGDSTSPDVVSDVAPIMDSGNDVTVVPDVGGPDIGPDVPTMMEAATQTGRECWAPDGGPYLCQAGQLCCANAMTYASQCATGSCASPLAAINCAGATGNYPDASLCGPSQVCCGSLTLNGMGAAPNCTATSLSSTCQASCNDLPPAGCGALNYTIRLCGTAADCQSDNGNPSCCRFGQSPVYWCVPATTALVAMACR